MKKGGGGGGGGQNVENKTQLPQWDKDWNLQPMNAHGLVDEYLEMGKMLNSCTFCERNDPIIVELVGVSNCICKRIKLNCYFLVGLSEYFNKKLMRVIKCLLFFVFPITT